MDDKLYICVDGETREATAEEITSIKEAQANAQVHIADSPSF